jgi:hypothetical protein
MGWIVGKPSATIATAWDVVSLVIALGMGCIDSRWWCLFCDLLSFLSYEISFQGCVWSCGWPNPCIVLRGHRSLRFLLPRPASTVTLSVTSSVSISSPGRSSRISCLPLTIVMWVSYFDVDSVVFSCCYSIMFEEYQEMPGFLTLSYMVPCRFPRSCVPTTSLSISPRMDLWASISFCFVFNAATLFLVRYVIQSQLIFNCTCFTRSWCLSKIFAGVLQDASPLTCVLCVIA